MTFSTDFPLSYILILNGNLNKSLRYSGDRARDPNLMRSHLKISLKSFKNLLTILAGDMKLIVDAILRRSH